MLAIALNPGFVMLAGALIVLAAPAAFRTPVMILSAIGALALLLAPDYGRYGAFAQIGLTMAPLALDALNYLFGLAFIVATMLIAIYASGRDKRYEDAAILLLAGAATSAMFVGDLVSFVAAAELAGLAATWIVFCAGERGAYRAGVRLLIWQGIEGLLLLAGVAFVISDGLRTEFGQMDARTIGGALFLGGLAIRVGAPLAHVWLKDVVPRASPAGAVALAVFPALVGVYGLARAFPGEPALIYGALGMMAIGAAFACAEDDLRRAMTYSLQAQLGVAIASIGLASPAGLAGGAAHAFTTTFAYLLVFMALGVFVRRYGSASAAALQGAAQTAPATTALLAIGALAAVTAPGLSGYVSFAVAREAARGDVPWLAPVFVAVAALAAAHTLMRPFLVIFTPPRRPLPAPPRAPVFSMLLAMTIAAFLCLMIGVAPAWLYALTPPGPIVFWPFTLSAVTMQVSALFGAAAAYMAVRAVGLAPGERAMRIMDVDALYRGPFAGIGRWTGVVMLRLYGVWQTMSGAGAGRIGRAFAAFARAGDRPYRDAWGGAAGFAAIVMVLALIAVAQL